MKNRILRPALLLGASFLLTTGVMAQDKLKTTDKESKLKTTGYKVKAKKDETKVKGSLPVRARVYDRTSTVTVEKKMGETDVRTKAAIVPVETRTTITESQPTVITTPAPVKMEKKAVYTAKRKVARKAPARKVAAHKTVRRRSYAAAKPKIVHVRDTVFVEKEPITRVVTNTEYVHDTVMLTRVDTVFKTQTFTGYKMPKVNYKKVRVKRDGNEIIMKKKTEDGKWIKEKFEDENDYNTYRHNTEK